MSSSLTPGACMEINLDKLYDTAFTYIKQAAHYEKLSDFAQAQQMYILGIESFLTIINKYETNASKKQLIKTNVKQFILKAEKLKDKIKNTSKFTPSAPIITDEGHTKYNPMIIKVPIYAIGMNECIENERFNIEISYNSTQLISNITDKILLYLNKNIKYFPKTFEISHIDEKSFIGFNIYDYDDLLKILNKPIMEYNQYDIVSKGLVIAVKIKKYIHKVNANNITCKYIIYKMKTINNNTQINPHLCPIYDDTMNKNIFNKNNLHHLRQFSHFKNEYIEKPECKFNEECPCYIELENGNIAIEYLCHVQLFRHPPRSKHRIIKLEETYINKFIINTNWNDNFPVYSPTEYDKQKYLYNKKNGYINALIEEIKLNGFKSDITDSILDIVNDKLNCLRHKAMGSPLNKGEMLALILYTSCDCNYEMSLSQRNGNYLKWKWFDYCLYFGIFNLSQNEIGDYMIYSGLTNVKLNNKEIKEGYFVSYVSATWMKHIAMEFINGEGMLIQFDNKFRKNDKIICCDASWISQFVDECEVIIARSDKTYCNDNFTAKVIDDRNGIQTVYIDKKY